MNPTETPNLEALETELKIGPYTVPAITLKTILLLERIGSPLVGQSRGEDNSVSLELVANTIHDIAAQVKDKEVSRENIIQMLFALSSQMAEASKQKPGARKNLPFTDTMEALWVLRNSERPDVVHVLADTERFTRAVNQLAEEVKLPSVPRIIADLSAAFAAVNKTFAEAGISGDDGSKKDPTGPSA